MKATINEKAVKGYISEGEILKIFKMSDLKSVGVDSVK